VPSFHGPEVRRKSSRLSYLDLWAQHVTRCAGNIIVARPVEARAAETAALSELEAA
jgi:hypothetical protein